MANAYSNQCRMCLELGAVHPIFDHRDDPMSIYSKLSFCLKEKIEDIPGYPRLICAICSNSLDIMFGFVKRYKHTCEVLKSNLPFIKKEADGLHDLLENNSYKNEDSVLVKLEPLLESQPKANLDKLLQKLPNITIKKNSSTNNVTKNKVMKGNSLSVNFVGSNKQSLANISKMAKIANRLSSSVSSKSMDKIVPTPPPLLPPQPVKPKEIYVYQRLCELCGEVFDNADRFSHHKKLHPLAVAMKCPLCDKEFDTVLKFNKHKQQAHVNREYICDTCGTSLQSNGHLKRHVREVHLGHPPPKRKCTCSLCGQEFRSYKSLRTHKKREHLIDNEIKM